MIERLVVLFYAPYLNGLTPLPPNVCIYDLEEKNYILNISDTRKNRAQDVIKIETLKDRSRLCKDPIPASANMYSSSFDIY